jgi:cell shape-determining protein MreC
MQAEEARRLTQLEKENARLKKLLAEAELEKAVLKDLSEGTVRARNPGVWTSRPYRSISGNPSVWPAKSWGNTAATTSPRTLTRPREP